MSSNVEKIPPAGLTQVEFLFASLIKLLTFTCPSAVSLSSATLVKGITPAVISGCPASLETSRRYAMRFVKVAKVIRAGSHPSPNATTRRQAAGVEPPHQIGIGLTRHFSTQACWLKCGNTNPNFQSAIELLFHGFLKVCKSFKADPTQKILIERSLRAYFFVSARPGLSSNEARCPYKNKYLVTAYCLRGNRRQRELFLI